MTDTLIQLAHSTLLPKSTAQAILAGRVPPLTGLVVPLVIASLDADTVTAGDKNATWRERLSRQLLGVTFLLALLLDHT